MTTPTLTRSDFGWIALMGVLVLPALFMGMFVSAAYVTPWLLGVVNCTERDALGKIIEAVALFSGLLAGFFVGLVTFGVISRAFASVETRTRWKQQFKAWSARQSRFQRWLGAYVLKAIGA